jgi:hypothetical protein
VVVLAVVSQPLGYLPCKTAPVAGMVLSSSISSSSSSRCRPTEDQGRKGVCQWLVNNVRHWQGNRGRRQQASRGSRCVGHSVAT